MKHASKLLIAAALIAPFVAIAASNSDGQFRDCERIATIDYQNRLVDVQNLFNQRRIQTAVDRRAAMIDTWNIEDDRVRRNVQRDIDRDMRNRDRDADKLLRDDQRFAQTDFRNAEKFCKDQMRQREKDRRNVPVGRQCFDTNECSPPVGACTVEFGECRTVCDGDACRCAGTCVIR
jgi:hypothetical protein